MFVECNAIRDITRHIVSRVGQKQTQYGKEKNKSSKGTWMMLKNKLTSKTAPLYEHMIHYSQFTVDSKSKTVHYSRDGKLVIECYVDTNISNISKRGQHQRRPLKTQSITRTKVLIKIKVFPTSAMFGPELENCGQHIDGILFLHEEATSELAVKSGINMGFNKNQSERGGYPAQMC
jgi:hypothetical protein